MKIDKYEKIGKGKYRLYLSNGEVIEIYDDVIISNELLLKKEIDVNIYNKILKDSELQENIMLVLNILLLELDVLKKYMII